MNPSLYHKFLDISNYSGRIESHRNEQALSRFAIIALQSTDAFSTGVLLLLV
jgi:hypothetical protein